MMYTDLFNPNYECDTKSREWTTRWTIQFFLKSALESCKRGNYTVAESDLKDFHGMLLYMLFIEDIDDMQKKFLEGIIKQIKKKYRLH